MLCGASFLKGIVIAVVSAISEFKKGASYGEQRLAYRRKIVTAISTQYRGTSEYRSKFQKAERACYPYTQMIVPATK